MKGAGALRVAVGLALSIGMTTASLVAVAWMGQAGSPTPRTPRGVHVAIEVAPPPPEARAPEPEPSSEPAPVAASRIEPRALARERAQPSELSSLSPLAGSTLGSSGLPGLAVALAPALAGVPVAESGSASDEPDTPARPTSRPTPGYPSEARRLGTEGEVVVRLRVDESGRVVDVVIVRADPPGVFEDVATEAAQRYRFRPARRGGRAVATTVEQRIVFRLGSR